MMEVERKYRMPVYRALPKGWDFSEDSPSYSKRWENWKRSVVEGSYVTNYGYKSGAWFRDQSEMDEYEREARRHYIICEDGCADWNMAMNYMQIEIDPDTLCEMTPYSIYETSPRGRKYSVELWENDIVAFERRGIFSKIKGVGIIRHCNDAFKIFPLAYPVNKFVRIVKKHGKRAYSPIRLDGLDGKSAKVLKVYGTEFEFIHRDKIFGNNKRRDPFHNNFLNDSVSIEEIQNKLCSDRMV